MLRDNISKDFLEKYLDYNILGIYYILYIRHGSQS